MLSQQEFYQLYLSLLRAPIPGAAMEPLALSQEAETSFLMEVCPLQDPVRFRARHFGLKIANLLIDEKGELQRETLSQVRSTFAKGLFPLGPNRDADPLIFEHLASCFAILESDGAIWNWIRKFSPPLCHRRAEEVIRETLYPESIRTLQPFHVSRAVLAAWLTWLRQTVGSCFATAPAILIQRFQPHGFFKDLYDLLTTGQLRRVIDGKEYAVPFPPTSGVGDLERSLVGIGPLAYAPGLIAALEAAQILSPSATQEEKREQLSHLLSLQEEKRNAKQLLSSILLQSCGLEKEDVEAEEQLHRLQLTPMVKGGIHYQRLSERAQRVADWKKRFESACTAFLAMTECSLLRVWEYAIASFCDVKVEFAKWNLYIGLGLHPNQEGGIAHFLQKWMEERLQRQNREIVLSQEEYERAVGEAKAAEATLLHTSSESQRHRSRGELASASHAANIALEMRDKAYAKAKAIAEFFPSLLQQYDGKLQEYFQEIFDPSVPAGEEHIYEDSPAGFRLVYKHGRAKASLWSPIQTEQEYADALREFFTSVETDIQIPPPLERDILDELMTDLFAFLRGPEFLKRAVARSRAAGRKSPWDYISGGTMQTLLQAYYSRVQSPTELKWLPRSSEELFALLLKAKEIAKKGPLLMHSPTHAFSFYPEFFSDHIEEQMKENRLFSAKRWEEDESVQEHLAHLLSERLPFSERPLFLHLFRQKSTAQTARQFRQNLLDSLGSSELKSYTSAVDSLLFEQLPVMKRNEGKNALHKILGQLSSYCGLPLQHLLSHADFQQPYIGSLELQQLAKQILLKVRKSPFSPFDCDREIRNEAARLGCAYPHPILFGDTNWSGWFLGWVVHPGTGELELWRLNRIGSRGQPMTDWKKWLTPQNTTPWILLPRPNEYR